MRVRVLGVDGTGAKMVGKRRRDYCFSQMLTEVSYCVLKR
jgi:hypothetical protein